MLSRELYGLLMKTANAGTCEGFDAHFVASVIDLSLQEGRRDGASLVEGLGLRPVECLALVGEMFPGVRSTFERLLANVPEPIHASDEICLRELLVRYASSPKFGRAFATIIARRSIRPNHLWQDLGLRNRRELSWLMERHFGPLAARNAQDMKWKKYLYRAICRDEGFALCVAPTCDECSDFEKCFGTEEGEPLPCMDPMLSASASPGLESALSTST